MFFTVNTGKKVMCASCLLSFLAGVALFGLGTGVKVAYIPLSHLMPLFDRPMIASIVVGSLMMTLSIFGSLAAYKEWKYALAVYVLLLIGLIVVKIWMFIVQTRELVNIHLWVILWLTLAFINLPITREYFSRMESYFGCCGTTGPGAYRGAIPISCCTYTVSSIEDCHSMWTQGCNERVADYMDTYGHAVIVTGSIALATEVVTILVGISLIHSIMTERGTRLSLQWLIQ